ncbi:hypothetical protein DW991_23080, partial [Bacteroides thetaiotaomicron]
DNISYIYGFKNTFFYLKTNNKWKVFICKSIILPVWKNTFFYLKTNNKWKVFICKSIILPVWYLLGFIFISLQS